MKFIDRLLTVVVTITLTSAAWILFGSTYLEGNATTSVSADPLAGVAPVKQDVAPTADRPAPMAQVPPGRVTTVQPLSASGLIVPVSGVASSQLTDTFTDERGEGSRIHEAIDIVAPEGTPVLAAASGKVEKLFRSDAGGNTIYMRSDDGSRIYYYAHLQAYAPGLGEGQQLRQGEPIGTVGSSGNADPATPHLHFAIMRTTPDAGWWEPSAAVNPFPLLRN